VLNAVIVYIRVSNICNLFSRFGSEETDADSYRDDRDGADPVVRAERRCCTPSRSPTISVGPPFCLLDRRAEFDRAVGENPLSSEGPPPDGSVASFWWVGRSADTGWIRLCDLRRTVAAEGLTTVSDIAITITIIAVAVVTALISVNGRRRRPLRLGLHGRC